MDELLKLLDGNTNEVEANLANMTVGLSHDDLLKLKVAEQDGENRGVVLAALDRAIASADTERAGGIVVMASDAVADPAIEQVTGSPASIAFGSSDTVDLVTGSTDTLSATDTVADTSIPIITAASFDTSPTADIAAATEFEASGAPVQSSGFDLDHASLDTNPRENTTETMNRIDFNDPVKTGREVVEAALKSQG